MAVLDARSKAVEGYLRAPLPAPSVPWREASYAVLGLEATGPDLRRSEFASVACVPVERGKVIIAKVSEAKTLDAILEALTGRILVAHAASVHVGLLSAALNKVRIRLRGPALDTAALAERVPRRAAAEGDRPPAAVDTSPGLSMAASGMGLPVHRPHQASGEALTAAQLFIALATHLDRAHPQSVGSLAQLGCKKRDLQLGRHSVSLFAEDHHRALG